MEAQANSSAGEVAGYPMESSATAMDGAVHREEVLVALRTRRTRLWNVFAIHQAVGGANGPLAFLFPRLSRWSSALDALERDALDSWSLTECAARLVVEMDDLERESMEADARVRPAAFRRSFDAARIDDDRLVDYLSLLGARIGSSVEQRDRFLSLARRLLVTTAAEGTRVLSKSEAAGFLSALSAGRKATDDHRRAALSFFHDSVERLHAASSFADVISGGLLIDVIGYKLTLGAEIADPEILYGLVALEAALEERLESLCALEGLPPGEVAWHAWKIALRMRRTFRKTALFVEKPTHEQFDEINWRRFRWRRGLGRLKAPELAAARWTRRSVLFVVFALTIGLWSARVIAACGFQHAQLTSLGVADLQDISSMLSSGAISGDAAPVFVGELNVWSWEVATAAERSAAASSILTALSARHVAVGMITADRVPMIQIEHGAVVRLVLPEAK